MITSSFAIDSNLFQNTNTSSLSFFSIAVKRNKFLFYTNFIAIMKCWTQTYLHNMDIVNEKTIASDNHPKSIRT